MYSKIVKYLNIPILYILLNKSNCLAYLKKLEKNQWLTYDEALILQEKLLIKLLKHALSNVPYYNNFIREHNINITDLNNDNLFDIYRKLPIIKKEDLQEHLSDLQSSIHSKDEKHENASGGSTGQPTIFYQDYERDNYREMDTIRNDRMSGWDIGEKKAIIWGASRDLKGDSKIKPKINNFLFYRKISLDAFELTDEKMQIFLKKICKEKPTIILAYANAAYFFSKFIKDNGLERDAKKINLKGIITSAEKLHGFQRDLIENVFECKVYDRFGSREVGNIAMECDRHVGMHISMDSVIVEFLDENGVPVKSGQPGRIVVTDLHNYAMPFIRYDIGDIGTPLDLKCTCGRGFPLMKCVEGRTSDFFINKFGKKVHGEYFTHLFYGMKGIREFQLIQESYDNFNLKIVRSNDFKESEILTIMDKIRKQMDDISLEINLEYVSRIKRPPSGKLRFTISKV